MRLALVLHPFISGAWPVLAIHVPFLAEDSQKEPLTPATIPGSSPATGRHSDRLSHGIRWCEPGAPCAIISRPLEPTGAGRSASLLRSEETMDIPSSSEPSSCCLNSWLPAEGNSSPRKTSAEALRPTFRAAGRTGSSREQTGLDASHLREARVRPYPCPECQSGSSENSGYNHCEALDVLACYDGRQPRRALGRQKPFPSGRGGFT
jgi:hypothetical protein